MRSHGLPLSLLVLVSLVSTRTADASQEQAAAFVDRILQSVPTSREPCPDPIEGAGPNTVFVCARTTADFGDLARSFDLVVTSADNPIASRPVTDWVTQSGGRIRWYAVGDRWVVVTIDRSTKRILLSYPRNRDGVFSLSPDITPPVRFATDDSLGATRRQARQGLKADAQGVVVISGVIRKNGRVENVEVLGCLPRHRGLEEAAANALGRWHYEPATKGGLPVDMAMVASFTYGPEGLLRASELSDLAEAGSNRTGGASATSGAGP